MRAALYTRVSKRDKGQETANQLRQLREFCATQCWIIVREYEDHESGGKADGTQFKAMMVRGWCSAGIKHLNCGEKDGAGVISQSN